MRTKLHGWIADFWEQGMEESPWLTFQDEKYCESPTGGWSREGLHRFAEGDHLTILGDDGEVLWTGVLEGRKSGWFSRLEAGSSDWHPEDVEAETWQGWFRRSPALRAVLELGTRSQTT